jgi:hypothetical protein
LESQLKYKDERLEELEQLVLEKKEREQEKDAEAQNMQSLVNMLGQAHEVIKRGLILTTLFSLYIYVCINCMYIIYMCIYNTYMYIVYIIIYTCIYIIILYIILIYTLLNEYYSL